MRPAFSARRLTALVSALIMLDMITWLAAVPLIPVWQDEAGLSSTQAGMVLGAYSLAVLLSSVPTGLLADRFGARRVTLIAAAGFAVVGPAIAFADSFELLIAVRFVQGLCSAAVWSAGLAWLASEVPGEQRNRSLYIANAVATAATIAGPVFGGPIVSAVGMVPAFGAVGLGIVGVLIWALIEPAANPDRPPAVAIDSGRESTARVALRPGLLRASFVAITWVSLAMGILHLLGPITLDGFGLTSAGIGWVFTVGSVLSVVAILTVARLSGRFERLRVVVRLVLVVGALSVAMIAPLGVWGYAIVLVAIIALSSPVFTVAYTLCADGARHAGIGEGAAFGVLNGLWATGAVISPIVAGVAEGGGVAPVAYALSAAIALGAALVIRRSSEPASAPA